MSETAASSAVELRRGTVGEVFGVALRLGLTSFGGPIAHLGYYERTYVRQRQWLTPDEYAGLVALCQMVPGPASSQVGYLIGLRRAGWGGAFAAWAGFTLPSAIVMFGFALLAPRLEGPTTDAVLHGLKLVAVAVVAQAVWSMARNLCPDRARAALALLAAALLLVVERLICPDRSAADRCGRWRADVPRPAGRYPALPAMPVSIANGRRGAGAVSDPAGGVAARRRCGAAQPAGAGRHLLQGGRVGVRRRPCRLAIAARRLGAAGLAVGQHLSRRLRRGPGDSRAALHLFRVSRRDRRTGGRRAAVVGRCAHFHVPAGDADRLGRSAGVAVARPSPGRAGGARRRSTPPSSAFSGRRSTTRSG